MANMWYYASKNQQKGPVSWDDLRGLARAGGLRGTDMVWQEGTPDWVKASSVPGLCNGAATAPTNVRADEPGARRRPMRDDPDDFDRDSRIRRPSRKPAKSNQGLIIGLCVGGGVLVIGIIVTIIIIANSGSSKVKGPPVAGGGPPPVGIGGGPVPPVVAPPPKAFGDPLGSGRPIVASRIGTRVEDALTNVDKRDPGSPDCFCKVYEVAMMPGKSYTIDYMQGFKGGGGGHFDPFLRLVDSKGLEVAADDDGGAGLNSRIVYRPFVADTYRIVCTSLGPNQTSSFTLIVRED